MAQPSDMTVHCLVRNEERFIRAALLSILPLAKRVLVYDTGSTDATLKILSSIQSEKVQIVRKTFSRPSELTDLRNEMIGQTTTEWFMLVDGDELYPAHAVRRISEEIQTVPPTVHKIAIRRVHFLGSFNFVSRVDSTGRIYRTKNVRWRPGAPPRYRPRADAEYLLDNPSASLQSHRILLPEDIFFFHCQYLARSSKDDEVGALRRWRWRKPPFPVSPYFGPWPETLELDGVARRMTPELCFTWLGLNTKILGAWGATFVRQLLAREGATWH
jgi:glycosyltransferase involved in cell wall biosynthesis